MIEKRNLKKNLYILGFIISLVIIGFLTSNFPIQLPNMIKPMILITFSIVILLFVIRQEQVNNLALNAFWIVLIFGVVVSLSKPVQFGLDEESHLKATLTMTDSPIFQYENQEQKDYINVEKHDMLRAGDKYQNDDYWQTLIHEESASSGKKVGFENLSYLPGVVGWNIGKLISDKVYVSYYLGRLSFVLVYALLVFAALKISQSYQKVIFILATLPNAINMVGGYNYDYLYYGCSLILVAIVTNVLTGKTQFNVKQLLVYQLCILGIAFSKLPIALLGFLPLFFPKKSISGWRVYLSTVLMSISIIVLGFARTISLASVTTTSTSSGSSLVYFARHPLPIIRTVLNAPIAVVSNFILNPIQYALPSRHTDSAGVATFLVFMVLMGLVSLYYKIKFSKKFTVGLSLLLLIIIFGIVYAISGDFRVYTLGDTFINGVQGRYYFIYLLFFPILLGIFLQRLIPNVSISSEKLNKYIVQTMIYLNIFVMVVDIFVHI